MDVKKIAKELGLTEKQEDDICYIIGMWYLKWKERFKGSGEHPLGVAKEDLKNMICGVCAICAEKECSHNAEILA